MLLKNKEKRKEKTVEGGIVFGFFEKFIISRKKWKQRVDVGVEVEEDEQTH